MGIEYDRVRNVFLTDLKAFIYNVSAYMVVSQTAIALEGDDESGFQGSND